MRRRECEGAIFELCENTTRPSPRQRSHPRLDSYEVLHSDGAQADGQIVRLNLHDTAGPEKRRDHQPASALPLPAPPRLVPRTFRRRHTIQQYNRGTEFPARLPDGQQQAHQNPGSSPSPTSGGAAPRPSPSLHSTSPVACAAQAHRLAQTAVCANVNTPLHAASSPLPLEALMDTPQCRNSGPRHQSKFMPKKTFRAAHTPPLVDNAPQYAARSPLHAEKAPQYGRNVEMPGLGIRRLIMDAERNGTVRSRLKKSRPYGPFLRKSRL